MNSIAKRLMAVFAVFVMIAAPAVAFLSDGQDSSATEIDCSKYYYNQLKTDLAKNVYDRLATVTAFDASFTVDLTASDLTEKASNPNYNRDEVSKAALAIGLDNPKLDYFYRQWSYSTGDSLTVTLTPFDTFGGATKSEIDAEINTLLAAVPVDVSSPYDYVKIQNIHNYVANKLSYNSAHMDDEDETVRGMIRSLYATLKEGYTDAQGGSFCVVCEGYAKLFKALCDYYGLKCVIVTGEAGTGGEPGPHMWNYVYLNDYWYLVDCTWDDQQSGSGDIRDTYLLAGSDKDGFNGYKVGASHIPCGTNTEDSGFVFTDVFKFPTLSVVSINLSTGEPDGVQHAVTFKVESEIYAVIYAKDGYAVNPPANPTTSDPAWKFLKWVKEDSSDYDMGEPVLADLTLVAVGTLLPIWTLSYDTGGGSPVAPLNVLQTENVAKVTVAKPVKEGYVFKSWNTSSTGNGIEFNGGDEIVMNGDYTLYAVWDDTSSISYKIDSIVDRVAVFLSEEMIPGVNNLLLSIGVVTAVISLLAILAISRK